MKRTLVVEYRNNEIIAFCNSERIFVRKADDADFDKFKEWIASYNSAVKQYDNRKLLLTIGRDIFIWLNLGKDWLARYLENAECPFIIEFQIPKKASDIQKAFIEVPWELLADEKEHLANDPDLKFCPIRRIGKLSKDKKNRQNTN